MRAWHIASVFPVPHDDLEGADHAAGVAPVELRSRLGVEGDEAVVQRFRPLGLGDRFELGAQLEVGRDARRLPALDQRPDVLTAAAREHRQLSRDQTSSSASFAKSRKRAR